MVTVGMSRGTDLWRYPIESVSNADSGFERVYQGSAVVAVRKLDLGPGEEESFSLVFTVRSSG